jgi:hypothetical protein
MDCKTARLLLDFARPQASELAPEEAGALEGHLDRCPDCHGLARGERQLDEQLGRAMRQVEVPAGLREHLLARLESERGDWHRRRFAHHARLAVAAAAVVLLSWAAWHWLIHRAAPPVDPEQVAVAANNEIGEDPRAALEAALKRMGVDTALSPHLNYHLLISPPSLAPLPGYPDRNAPMLVFLQNRPPHRHATVYLIAAEQIPDTAPPIVGSATYKVEILPSAGERYTFLVVHDGDNLDWLRPPEPPGA